MGTLTGKVVAITGAGGGIGSALAREFSKQGAHLALSDIDVSGLESLVDSLSGSGQRVTMYRVDVSNADDFFKWARCIESEHGGLDILVNNAGVTRWGSFEKQSVSDIDWVMDINLRGMMYGCRALLPLLRKAERASIVNVASMIALMSIPMQVTYTASKWAARGFSRALRLELADDGIGVITVLPGTIATGFLGRAKGENRHIIGSLARMMEQYGTSPDYVARRVLGAIGRNQKEVRIGWDSHLVAWVQFCMPGLLPTLVRFLSRRLEQKKLGGPGTDDSKSKPGVDA